MKLRNKKTGEIVEYDSIGFRKGQSNGWEDFIPNADSLAALKEVWEDYKPAEPLIKNEKIRKAVRAWAEANSLKWAAYSADGKFYDKTIDTEISFKTYTNRTDIPECRILPIAELCGEEEE